MNVRDLRLERGCARGAACILYASSLLCMHPLCLFSLLARHASALVA